MDKHAPKFFLFIIVIILMIALYFSFQNSFLIPDPLVVQSASLSEDYLLHVNVCNPNDRKVSLFHDSVDEENASFSGSLTLYSGDMELSRYPFTIWSFDTSFGYEQAQSCGNIRIDLSKRRSLQRLSGDFSVVLTLHYSLNGFDRQSSTNMSLIIESNQPAIDLFISSSPAVFSICSGDYTLPFAIQNLAKTSLDSSESVDYQLVICDANDHSNCSMQRSYLSGFVNSTLSGHKQDLSVGIPFDSMLGIASGDLVYQLTLDPLGALNTQHSLNAVTGSIIRTCSSALMSGDSIWADLPSLSIYSWLVYRDDIYDFTITFPLTWSGYVVHSWLVSWWEAGKSETLLFWFESQKDLFVISVHKPNQWQTIQLLADTKPLYLWEHDRYVFGYSKAGDVISNLIDRYEEIDEIADSFSLLNTH